MVARRQRCANKQSMSVQVTFQPVQQASCGDVIEFRCSSGTFWVRVAACLHAVGLSVRQLWHLHLLHASTTVVRHRCCCQAAIWTAVQVQGTDSRHLRC